MKKLIQFIVLAGLVGCATPYYPVYVNNDGDYYITERSSAGPYYGSNTILYSDLGVYPWWVSTYPPQTFVYYSPNFYPYRFSVWYPPYYSPFYHPFYGFYGRYDPYWCPPYRRIRNVDRYGDNDEVVGSRVVLPVVYSATPVSGPTVWRSESRAAIKRQGLNQKHAGNGVAPSTRSVPVYSRTSPSSPATTSGVWRTESLGRPSTGNRSLRSSSSLSKSSVTYHRQ